MPIIECDPWREQYFAHIPCPPDLIVPTDFALAGHRVRAARRRAEGVPGVQQAGVGGENGAMFDHWIVYADARPALEDFLGGWLSEHLREYTGMVSFETIGGKIIECHLRFSDQWPDLYGGDPWVRAVVELYKSGKCEFEEGERRKERGAVGRHGEKHAVPDEDLLARLRVKSRVSSLQITFDPSRREGRIRNAAWRIQAGDCELLEPESCPGSSRSP